MRIYHAWRKYQFINSLEGKLKEEKAVILQKYARGMITRQHLIKELGFDILKPPLKYLTTYMDGVLESAQIKIAYCWRRYLKQKAAKKKLKN